MTATEVSTPGAWARPGAIGGAHTRFSARRFSSGELTPDSSASAFGFRRKRSHLRTTNVDFALQVLYFPPQFSWRLVVAMSTADVPLAKDKAGKKCMRYGADGRRGREWPSKCDRMLSPGVTVAEDVSG